MTLEMFCPWKDPLTLLFITRIQDVRNHPPRFASRYLDCSLLFIHFILLYSIYFTPGFIISFIYANPDSKFKTLPEHLHSAVPLSDDIQRSQEVFD